MGFFSDPVEAARAYDRAAIEWRGEKAITNFPRDSYTDDGQQAAFVPQDAASKVNTFTVQLEIALERAYAWSSG